MPTLSPGLYEAQADVNIRREPRVVEYKVAGKFITNRVGAINVGTQRIIFSLLTNDKGETWGRVSEADSAGIAEWVCVQNLNRRFMKPISSAVEVTAPSGDAVDALLDEIEKRIAAFDARLDALEAWARSQGFKG